MHTQFWESPLHKLLQCIPLILLAACATADARENLPATISAEETAPAKGFANFITRDGARLYDGDEEFRFMSVNIPTLWFIEDDWSFANDNPYRLPTEYEIRDVLGGARELGSNLVRAYTIPVRNQNFPEDAVTFVEAPGVFNETAFQTMDLAIAVAAENGIRLVVPLVNNWEWMGGRPNYAAFRGKDGDAFCTDPQIRDDFKQTIAFVLNRVNTVTGVRYSDDPTIMAWETGNEMTCPGEWAVDIARTIKSHAPRQLVIDGWHAVHMPYEGEIIRDFPRQHSIDEPAIDLISTHHYEEDPAAMLRNLRDTLELIDGAKPIFLGEFGFMSPPAMEKVYDYVISEPAIPGGLIWSLRRHHEKGGWLHHSEPLGAGLYRAYHWPGFDDGEAFGERAFLQLLRQKAYEIRGLPAPAITTPPPPKLLAITDVGAINWQGSLGASTYTIERTDAERRTWTAIATDIDDIHTPGFDLLSDTSAQVGESYFYRVIARNAAGHSAPSNVVGPVTVKHLRLVDNARGYDTAARWRNIEVRSGSFAQYKEAYSRLHGGPGSELLYTVPGEIAALRVYAYEAGDEPALRLSLADVSESWTDRETEILEHPVHRGLTPREYRVDVSGSAGFDYLRLAFVGEADIVRVEVDYR